MNNNQSHDFNDRENVNNYHNKGGKFAFGNPGKPKGSSKNKLRDDIKSFINDNWKDFPSWFAKLKEQEKIRTMLDLLPYCVSRLQSVSMTDQEGNDKPEYASIDYTKLSEPTLREIIAATTLSESDNV